VRAVDGISFSIERGQTLGLGRSVGTYQIDAQGRVARLL